MTSKKNKPPKLNLPPEDIDIKSEEMSHNQTKNANVQSVKDMDKLGNLKPPLSPLTKKWFRKQFGIRKDIAHLQDGAKPQTVGNASFQKGRRRSSSLPDLAAMLDAASIKDIRRHNPLIARSRPGSVRMAAARKEPILSK